MLNRTLNTPDDSATQLVLPLDGAVLIEENDSIRSFCELLEGVNLKAYVKKSTKGRHDYEDLTLIRILLFATMNQITSLRDIEAACRNDIRFIWLGQGIQPSHMAFQRLINERLNGRFEDLFLDINKHLIEKEMIHTDVLHIDGTKFEANATKKITSGEKRFRITKRSSILINSPFRNNLFIRFLFLEYFSLAG